MRIPRLYSTGAAFWIPGGIARIILLFFLFSALGARRMDGQQHPQSPAGAAVPPSAQSPSASSTESGANEESADTLDTTPPTDETEDGSNPNPGPVIVMAPRLKSSADGSAEDRPIVMPVVADAGGNTQRQQINKECANLLFLAEKLQAEVNKTNVDVLSVPVVRNANQIEQLAHRMRIEIKPELSSSK